MDSLATPDVAEAETTTINLWLSPGVLPEEEPLIGDSDGVDYKGVRMPFSFAAYLLKGHECAEKDKGHLNVAVSGLGRLVKEYGVADTRRLLEDSSASAGTPEQRDYLERIIALERMRCAVTRAVVDVLRLNSIGEVVGVTEEMISNNNMRNDVLSILEHLLNKSEVNISYFGRRVALGSALEDAIPEGKKGGQEIFYPATEVAVASHLTGRTSTGTTIYGVPRGSGTIATGGKIHTRNECLRVAGIEAIGLIDRMRANNLANSWRVNEDLDGLAFFQDGKGKALSCDPYYLRHEDTYGNGDERTTPRKVPMLPWTHGWITQNMTSNDGIGVAQGQAQDVVRRNIAPVLRRHLKLVLADPSGIAQLRGSWGHKFDQMERWVADPTSRLLTPYDAMPKFNDAVRGICEAVIAGTKKHASGGVTSRE